MTGIDLDPAQLKSRLNALRTAREELVREYHADGNISERVSGQDGIDPADWLESRIQVLREAKERYIQLWENNTVKLIDGHRIFVGDYAGLTQLAEANDIGLENVLSGVKEVSPDARVQKLDLSGRELSDLTGIEQLSAVTALDLSNNELREIKGLGNLKDLGMLSLWANQIISIEPLISLTHLHWLNIGDNKIRDISFLKELGGLKTVCLFKYHQDTVLLSKEESARNLNMIRDLKARGVYVER